VIVMLFILWFKDGGDDDNILIRRETFHSVSSMKVKKFKEKWEKKKR
jgi:hypothetical protein